MISIIIALLLCYIALFIIAVRIKDNSIVDIFWGFGFVLITWILWWKSSVYMTPQIVVALLVTAWGMRLTFNIAGKKLPLHQEDRRYALWRKQWKYFYIRSFFQVFLLQGCLMLFIALPIFIVNMNSGFEESLFFTMLGGIVALFGLLYETQADAELNMFLKTKKPGEILKEGLRKFHRYPQYFGESVFWFGIAIITAQISLWGFVGWGIISFLVFFVSGIPFMEEHYKNNPDYQKYSEYTSKIFPSWNKGFCKK